MLNSFFFRNSVLILMTWSWYGVTTPISFSSFLPQTFGQFFLSSASLSTIS